MAEFCNECFKSEIVPGAIDKYIVLSREECHCEGCGKLKRVVLEYDPKKYVYKIQKQILKANSAEEVDKILNNADERELRDVVKLLLSRLHMLCFERTLEIAHERDEDK